MLFLHFSRAILQYLVTKYGSHKVRARRFSMHITEYRNHVLYFEVLAIAIFEIFEILIY